MKMDEVHPHKAYTNGKGRIRFVDRIDGEGVVWWRYPAGARSYHCTRGSFASWAKKDVTEEVTHE